MSTSDTKKALAHILSPAPSEQESKETSMGELKEGIIPQGVLSLSTSDIARTRWVVAVFLQTALQHFYDPSVIESLIDFAEEKKWLAPEHREWIQLETPEEKEPEGEEGFTDGIPTVTQTGEFIPSEGF